MNSSLALSGTVSQNFVKYASSQFEKGALPRKLVDFVVAIILNATSVCISGFEFNIS